MKVNACLYKYYKVAVSSECLLSDVDDERRTERLMQVHVCMCIYMYTYILCLLFFIEEKAIF